MSWGSRAYASIITPYFSPEERGSKFLRNVGIYLQVHMMLQPGRPTPTRFIQLRTGIKRFALVNNGNESLGSIKGT
jgi:hypothetical protein